MTKTNYAIFMTRMMTERSIKVSKFVQQRFIIYAKELRHKELFELLGNLDLLAKVFLTSHNLYWEQTSYIRRENELIATRELKGVQYKDVSS